MTSSNSRGSILINTHSFNENKKPIDVIIVDRLYSVCTLCHTLTVSGTAVLGTAMSGTEHRNCRTGDICLYDIKLLLVKNSTNGLLDIRGL